MTWQDEINVPVNSRGEVAAKKFYGDPKLAAAYLPVAYALLGGVKNQMTLSGIGYGHRMVELKDGTRIRVIRNGEQNLVMIDVSVPTRKQESVSEALHGFCFFPKTLANPNGWIYEDEKIIESETWKGSNGAVVYTVKGKQIVKKEGKFGVPYSSGNQFCFNKQDVYSWMHSGGGDLPMPVVRVNQPGIDKPYTPYLIADKKKATMVWVIPKKVDGKIENSTYVLGSNTLGIGVFNEVIFTVSTPNFRSISVSGVVDEVGEPFKDDIYDNTDTRDDYWCLTGKAFIADDGSQFTVISGHHDGYKVRDYKLTMNDDGVITITKSIGKEYPVGVNTYTTEYSKVYTGDPFRMWADYNYYTQRINSFGCWDYTPGAPDGEPPPEGYETSGSGHINDIKTSITVSEEPIAVIYDGLGYRIVTLKYTSTYLDSKKHQEDTTAKLEPYLFINEQCRKVWIQRIDSTITVTRNNITSTEVKSEICVDNTPIFVVSENTAYSSSDAELIYTRSNAERLLGIDSTTNSTFSNKIGSTGIQNSLLFYDFKNNRSIHYKTQNDNVYDNNGSIVETTSPDTFTYTGSNSRTDKNSYHLVMLNETENELYTYGKNLSESSDGNSGDAFTSIQLANTLVTPVESSSSVQTPAPGAYINSFVFNNYGPATIVYEGREDWKADNLYMYDILFHPLDEDEYKETPKYEDKKKYYFHGDSLGGAVANLPFDTSEVYSHVIGLF